MGYNQHVLFYDPGSNNHISKITRVSYSSKFCCIMFLDYGCMVYNQHLLFYEPGSNNHISKIYSCELQ